MPAPTPRAQEIVRRVRQIPRGAVCTYADIDPHAPRYVGIVLAQSDERMPWHRVVRADGSLSKGERQRALLAAEGVPMRGDRVNMAAARLPLDWTREYEVSASARTPRKPSTR